MEIKDGKIIKATRVELYEIWLDRFEMLIPFSEYLERMMNVGVEVED